MANKPRSQHDGESSRASVPSKIKKQAAPASGAGVGFISDDDVRAHKAERMMADLAPSAEEMAEASANSGGKASKQKLARAGSKSASLLGKDLLTSYMEQLSHLPLFKPEEELEYARQLEVEEVKTWQLLLASPRAVEMLLKQLVGVTDFAEPLREELTALEVLFRKAAARSHKKHLGEAPKIQEAIAAAAQQLRVADFDKELIDKLMEAVRQEVWSRRVLTDSLAYRITHAELTDIERSRGSGLRIRNHFVRANLRLVVSVARKFHHFRIPFIDLIQEGNVGLMKAVHRFDHKRGFRFSTYAHWWIRQSIERAIINKASQVRLPVHVIDARRQVGRASAKLSQTLGRSPSAQEIADAMQTTLDKVEAVLTGVQQDPVSLDESVNGEDPRKYLDLVRDPEAAPIDEALIRENTHAKVRELLHLLNPIEKDIIRRRFGLGVDADQTLDEIGKRYNLSRERVRQIQAQSLLKMRRMCERRQID